MLYKILFIFIFTTSNFYAETFKQINPAPTKKMLENQANAKTCDTPHVANQEITEDFNYGCFCGKDYPKMPKDLDKDFRKLNKEQRTKLIESYYLIKPYDEIDAVCQQHDICYLYQGKRAKVCNSAIYDDLHLLTDKFKVTKKIETKKTKTNQQCQNLSSDMASVFHTIFTTADDEDSNPFNFGVLMFNTSIVIANKVLEESIDTIINQGDRYPKEGHKCISSKNK